MIDFFLELFYARTAEQNTTFFRHAEKAIPKWFSIIKLIHILVLAHQFCFDLDHSLTFSRKLFFEKGQWPIRKY